jgi:UDP-N-acetylmuramoylalanine--D-glutamate ligase
MGLRGPHNRSNAACAAAAAWLMGAPPAAIERALAEFKPLPHRLETVAVIRGVEYVEDSKGTTPESTIAALHSFDSPIHLIAGGSPKGASFAELGKAIAGRAASVALIGQTAGEIEAAVRAAGESPVRVIRCVSLEEAVQALCALARPGDVVLLSPACASFGMFRNYVDRAEKFREIVRQMGEDANRPPDTVQGAR